MLAAMKECTEWGVVFMLDCLAKYDPDPNEAKDVIERVSPHLLHSNAAVILSAVRVPAFSSPMACDGSPVPTATS